MVVRVSVGLPVARLVQWAFPGSVVRVRLLPWVVVQLPVAVPSCILFPWVCISVELSKARIVSVVSAPTSFVPVVAILFSWFWSLLFVGVVTLVVVVISVARSAVGAVFTVSSLPWPIFNELVDTVLLVLEIFSFVKATTARVARSVMSVVAAVVILFLAFWPRIIFSRFF